MNRLQSKTAVSETECQYIIDQHQRRFYIDVEGYSVRAFHIKVTMYVGDTPVVVDSGICWASSVAQARKLLGEELRNRKDWRGCDGHVVEG